MEPGRRSLSLTVLKHYKRNIVRKASENSSSDDKRDGEISEFDYLVIGAGSGGKVFNISRIYIYIYILLHMY